MDESKFTNAFQLRVMFELKAVEMWKRGTPVQQVLEDLFIPAILDLCQQLGKAQARIAALEAERNQDGEGA